MKQPQCGFGQWNGKLTSIAYAVATVLSLALSGALEGCAERAITGPDQSVVRLSPPTATYYVDVDDPCWNDENWSCHDDGEYASWDDYTGFEETYWESYECDGLFGCTTWPLGTGTRNAIIYQLNNEISSSANCQNVRKWLLARVNLGKIRFFTADDGTWGDFHFFTGNLHLHTNTFLPGNEWDLRMTLMHEGFHGYYSSHDDISAENFAESCVF